MPMNFLQNTTEQNLKGYFQLLTYIFNYLLKPDLSYVYLINLNRIQDFQKSECKFSFKTWLFKQSGLGRGVHTGPCFFHDQN